MSKERKKREYNIRNENCVSLLTGLEHLFERKIEVKVLLTITLSFVMLLTMHAQDITTIDLTKVKFGEIAASEIFEEIKFIPLETHPDGLLNITTTTYYLTDKYILAITFLRILTGASRAYLFDRETGAFIKQVSSFGQGPNEFTGWLYDRYGFDEKNGLLFASDGQYIGESCKGINIETNKVELIVKKPLHENVRQRIVSSVPWFLKDNMYLSFVNNITGKDKVKLIVYDKEGTVIKRYPNYLEYKKEETDRSMPDFYGIFYYFNGNTYFKEFGYNDTIFCVDEKNLTPHIVFHLGIKQPSYYLQRDSRSRNEKYLIQFVYESNSFVLFNFTYPTETIQNPFLGGTMTKSASRHTGYYDKKSKQVYISSTPDYKKSGYVAPGLPVNFFPISVNSNNEVISHINPEELIINKDRIDPKYSHLFENIQEDDNPVVIIAKLKN